jgi:exopolysaccharide biosynthesis polyprenyl glycosylphosphotransferase
MLKEQNAVVRRLMIVFDITVIAAAFFLAYVFRTHFHSFYSFDLIPSHTVIGNNPGHFSQYVLFLIFAAPLWCYLLYRNGAYHSWRLRRSRTILWNVSKASAFAFLILGALLFLFKFTFMSRVFFIVFAVTGFLFLLVEKISVLVVMHEARRRGYNYRQLLMVGTGRRAELFLGKIHNHPEWGLRVIGAVEDELGRGIERVNGVNVIGDLKDLVAILHRETVDEVVFIVPRLRLHHIENAIHECETEGVKATIAVDLFDFKIAKASTSELDGMPLLSMSSIVPNQWQLLAKRIMDLVVSGILIILLSPVLTVIAILVKITSRGPVFFKQTRVGLNKRRFIIYKCRTMVEGSQKELSQVDIYKEIYEPDWKKKKMRLVTPIGKFLRKFSLDELPQIFNVFLGHMSLVGPRPTLPEEVEQYESWHRRRFSMRPGLTCLWQVNGRRDVKFDEWMKMDLEYLDHWSLWLDIKILIKTIPAVFFSHGAY